LPRTTLPMRALTATIVSTTVPAISTMLTTRIWVSSERDFIFKTRNHPSSLRLQGSNGRWGLGPISAKTTIADNPRAPPSMILCREAAGCDEERLGLVLRGASSTGGRPAAYSGGNAPLGGSYTIRSIEFRPPLGVFPMSPSGAE